MKRYSTDDERAAVRTVIGRWDKNYPPSKGQRYSDISTALHAIDVETATAEDIAKIIGNSSWVRLPECENCGAVTREAVGVGEDDPFESERLWLCINCLRLAVRLIEG